jgi:hypothetical protein
MDLVQAKPCTCPGTGLRSMHWYVTDLFSNDVLVSGAHVVTASDVPANSLWFLHCALFRSRAGDAPGRSGWKQAPPKCD